MKNAYAIASGKAQLPEKIDTTSKDEADKISKLRWLEDTHTKDFFSKLESDYQEAIDKALREGSTGQNAGLTLMKAKTIKEIIDYGSRN
jgi:replication fork clamp-binding protein CrfC